MTEAAALYHGACRLLSSAKAAGWKISRTPAGCWRVTHPSGAGLTLEPRPTVRGLLAAEAQLRTASRGNTLHPPPAKGPA